jgi:hypothetical protein
MFSRGPPRDYISGIEPNQIRVVERELKGASPRQSKKKGSAEDWLWLREIVEKGVNKSNHPIQNPLLSVTQP